MGSLTLAEVAANRRAGSVMQPVREGRAVSAGNSNRAARPDLHCPRPVGRAIEGLSKVRSMRLVLCGVACAVHSRGNPAPL
jgi:hypothetical protein